MACRGNASTRSSSRCTRCLNHESFIPSDEQNRPSEEPYALIGLVRVCGGAAGKPAALPGRGETRGGKAAAETGACSGRGSVPPAPCRATKLLPRQVRSESLTFG